MSKEETRIAYIGSALESGMMDVNDLAPAMLALGELCNRANETLTGHEKRVSVQVSSDFKAGSFEFTVLVEVWKPLKEFLTSDNYVAAKELLGWIGIAGGGGVTLLALIRRSRGRKPETTVKAKDGMTTLTFKDGEKINVPEEVLKLLNTPSVRRAVKKVVAPLESEGVEGLEIRDPKRRGKTVEKISREDAPYYAEIPDHGEISENEIELLLQPVTVHLEGGSQWTFRRGPGEILKAKIADKEFARKMKTGEISFRRGDVIRARVRERQWEQGGELKTKYEIIEVLECREARGKTPPAPDEDQSAAG